MCGGPGRGIQRSLELRGPQAGAEPCVGARAWQWLWPWGAGSKGAPRRWEAGGSVRPEVCQSRRPERRWGGHWRLDRRSLLAISHSSFQHLPWGLLALAWKVPPLPRTLVPFFFLFFTKLNKKGGAVSISISMESSLNLG